MEINREIRNLERNITNHTPINKNQAYFTSFKKHVGNDPLRKSYTPLLPSLRNIEVMLDGQSKIKELTPEIVRKLYWDEKKSLPEIASIFKVHHETIRRFMQKHEISLRSRLDGVLLVRKKLKASKDELYELYWKREMKLEDIGKLFSVTGQTIWRALRKHGIPRRTYSQARAVQIRKISTEELKRLYLEEKKSLRELGKYVKVRPKAIKKMLIESNVRLREPGEAILKYERRPFSGDDIEKFYMIGLRVGDLHVQRDSRMIVVSISSSHPSMIKLIHDHFSRYGHYWKMPHKTKFGYDYHVKYYLDSSFEFLLDKKKITVPVQPELFLSFLAGYSDAEGYWKIGSSKGYIEVRLEIESQDYDILTQLCSMLMKLGFSPKLYLTRKRGTKIGPFILKKDMYRLCLMKRKEVTKLAKLLLPFVRHLEKKQKINLLLESVEYKKYKEIEERVIDFRKRIKEDVAKFTHLARENHDLNSRRLTP